VLKSDLHVLLARINPSAITRIEGRTRALKFEGLAELLYALARLYITIVDPTCHASLMTPRETRHSRSR
jgi:hypothetical protein